MTAYAWLISVWSSDVCSSDLTSRARFIFPPARRLQSRRDLRSRYRPVWKRKPEHLLRFLTACWSNAFVRQLSVNVRRLRSSFQMSARRSEEHTSELQSLMRISYAVFCLKKKINTTHNVHI